MARVSFVIVERAYLLRRGLVSAINEFPGAKILLETADERQAIELVDQKAPHFLVINTQDNAALEILTQPGRPLCGGQTRLVGFHESQAKPLRNQKLFHAILYLDSSKAQVAELLNRLISPILKAGQPSQSGELSARERTIIRHVALGLTNQQIAEKLLISKHTVITHRKNITAKLGINSVSGLTVYALLNQIIAMEEVNKA